MQYGHPPPEVRFHICIDWYVMEGAFDSSDLVYQTAGENSATWQNCSAPGKLAN
jgi:hypothetical protein